MRWSFSSLSLLFVLGFVSLPANAQTKGVPLKSTNRVVSVPPTKNSAVTSNAPSQTMQLYLDNETRNLLRESTSDKWFKKDVLIGTLLGGFLAIAGGLMATLCAHQLQANHKQKEDQQFADNVLRAIRFELEGLLQIYETGIGAKLKEVKEGEMFHWRLALTQDWYTAFNSNAIHLGKIEGDISRRILMVYMMIKKLVEEFRVNNGYLEQYELASENARLSPGDVSIAANVSRLRRLLLNEVQMLRAYEAPLQKAFAELIVLLDERGIK